MKIETQFLKKFFLVATLVSTISSVLAAPSDFSRTTVFSAGDEGIYSYRIPSLVTTKEGTLIAACEARKNSWKDKSPTNIAVKRSTDRGETWSELSFLTDGYDGNSDAAYMDPLLLVDTITGQIFLFTCMWAESECTDNIPFVLVSNDDGVSWSEPKSVITEFTYEDGGCFLGFGPGSGIQLFGESYKGRLVVPIRLKDKQGGKIYSRNRVVYSDDNGETWKKGKRLALIGEWQIAELSDGSLYYNSRANGKRFAGHSADGGDNFNFFIDTSLPTIEKGCQSSVLTYGEELLYCGVTGGEATETHDDRKNLELFRSDKLGKGEGEDFSNTWGKRTLLYSKASGYSCMSKLNDGSIAILFEAGDDDGFTLSADRPAGWMRLDLIVLPSSFFTTPSALSQPYSTGNTLYIKENKVYFNDLDDETYSLYFVSGAMVKSGEIRNKSIDFSNINHGVYFLKIKNKTYKIIKQ